MSYIIDLYTQGNSALKISKQENIPVHQIYKILEKNNIPRRSNRINNKKYSCNEDYFENINTSEKAYWLGFLYADGFVSKNEKFYNRGSLGISLAIEDKEHLETLNKDLNSNYPINIYSVVNGYKIGIQYARIIIKSEKIFNDLIDKGLSERKSEIKKRPKKIPEELIKYFILGYFDGNGCISIHRRKNNDKLNFKFRITSTDDVLYVITDYLYNNKLIYNKRKLDKRHIYDIVSNLEYGGNRQVYKIMHHLYQNTPRFLKRKHERYLILKNQLMKEGKI